jgi:HEAT repeat protein
MWSLGSEVRYPVRYSPVLKLILLQVPLALAGLAASSEFSLPAVYSTSGQIQSQTIALDRLGPDQAYSLLFSIAPPGPDARLIVELVESGQTKLAKTLHAGDSDFYSHFRTGSAGKRELRLVAANLKGAYRLEINRWPDSASLKRGGNHSWKTASSMTLGQTVFASSDEAEYIPLPGVSRKENATATAGEDWYRFHFDSPVPRLVYFQVELTDRDDLPVDVAIYRLNDGAPVEYSRGQDPVAAPHEVQALPGNKFAPRILEEAGDYYVRVRANHPEYKLRTRLYGVPPYSDPREAVRAAADYILGAGDSWFANTPRRGGTLDRIAPVHQETSLCVACHPSHFSLRAQLYANVNGYPVVQRQQMHFLTERFYNNPRPFYGFEDQGAVWSRVISAPANVLSRMSVLTSLFETQVSRQERPAYHDRITKYLDLYYAGRTQLPPDETNGNTPLVSTFEVAWYSWKSTKDARLPEMIAATEVKNTIDLCYQTLALADIDKVRYKDQIRRNAERILSLQRPDGQWSMRFEPKEQEVEFQTGHALWALAAAGIPADQPQVKKAIDYLMLRQQGFGGWMDPLQTFENFRTPFRETQFAVVALSSYFPLSGRAKGWNSPPVANLSHDPVTLLQQLDEIWDPPSPHVLKQLEAAAGSNEVLIRQAATEALGRLAAPASIPFLAGLLGDESKLVQRTAAWALRQVYGAHPESEDREIIAALGSTDGKVRWGAMRIFAHQFSTLAQRSDVMRTIQKRAQDPVVSIRMQAIRALWQGWFWNAHTETRNAIEDTLLVSLKAPQHAWVETNLEAAIYNLADENIRYFYNNWVALLARPEDREKAIQGRLAVESQLAKKFAAILNGSDDPQKKRLLTALAQLSQRRADIYDVESDLSTPAPPVYNRLGNDIEQIAFFGTSADLLARALLPLIKSTDPEMRRVARQASLMVRETPYNQVERAAGGTPDSVKELARRLDATPDAVEISKAFHIPPPRPPSKTAPAAPPLTGVTTLDEKYFRANVEPILEKKGEDGYACVNCHATHTLFNATWSTVLNVVDTSNPENSLLLRKPTSTAESEGVAGAKATAHGGGRRWPKDSPPYDPGVDQRRTLTGRAGNHRATLKTKLWVTECPLPSSAVNLYSVSSRGETCKQCATAGQTFSVAGCIRTDFAAFTP